jgi:hypothetical protein
LRVGDGARDVLCGILLICSGLLVLDVLSVDLPASLVFFMYQLFRAWISLSSHVFSKIVALSHSEVLPVPMCRVSIEIELDKQNKI